MNKKRIIILILVLALIGGGGIVTYYNYQNTHYVITDNAQVISDLIKIYPQIQGKISNWNVKEGDIVKADQLLANQDMEASVKSSVMNSQTLNSDADSFITKAEIKSPISGRVVQISAAVGQMVGTSTNIAVISDTSNFYVNANIKEVDIANVRVGQKVEITIDAFGKKVFTGCVDSIKPAAQSVFSLIPAQNASGNYTKVTELIPLKISIVNDANVTLMPGMNANVKIYIR